MKYLIVICMAIGLMGCEQANIMECGAVCRRQGGEMMMYSDAGCLCRETKTKGCGI